MLLSVIVPAHNEEASLGKFLPHLEKVLKGLPVDDYEVIVVNDGSTDTTLKLSQKIAKKSSHLKVLSLSRNFGKEIATTAGLFEAHGDAMVLIDADGQHPPELIADFLRLWKDGYQVVVGVRRSNQKEGLIKRYGARLFYRIMSRISDLEIIPGSTDFRLIDRAVRDEFTHFTEHYRMTRGLIDWIGFRRTTVPFHAKKRIGGSSPYKVSRLIKLALNGFVSLSMTPLYIIGYVGVIITGLSFILGCFIIVEQLVLNDPWNLNITGTAMLSVLILFLVGILLTAQGLMSIYLTHIHVQTQNRPLFIVDRKNSQNLGASNTRTRRRR